MTDKSRPVSRFGVRITVLNTKQIWRFLFLWGRRYFQLLWLEDLAWNEFLHKWDWNTWRPILTIDRRG